MEEYLRGDRERDPELIVARWLVVVKNSSVFYLKAFSHRGREGGGASKINEERGQRELII